MEMQNNDQEAPTNIIATGKAVCLVSMAICLLTIASTYILSQYNPTTLLLVELQTLAYCASLLVFAYYVKKIGDKKIANLLIWTAGLTAIVTLVISFLEKYLEGSQILKSSDTSLVILVVVLILMVILIIASCILFIIVAIKMIKYGKYFSMLGYTMIISFFVLLTLLIFLVIREDQYGQYDPDLLVIIIATLINIITLGVVYCTYDKSKSEFNF